MFKIGRTLFSYWGQFDPKIPQKHPIFRGGPAPPKCYYFAKRFLPCYFPSRKPPVYEFSAYFLKIKILLRMTLSHMHKFFTCDKIGHERKGDTRAKKGTRAQKRGHAPKKGHARQNGHTRQKTGTRAKIDTRARNGTHALKRGHTPQNGHTRPKRDTRILN